MNYLIKFIIILVAVYILYSLTKNTENLAIIEYAVGDEVGSTSSLSSGVSLIGSSINQRIKIT